MAQGIHHPTIGHTLGCLPPGTKLLQHSQSPEAEVALVLHAALLLPTHRPGSSHICRPWGPVVWGFALTQTPHTASTTGPRDGGQRDSSLLGKDWGNLSPGQVLWEAVRGQVFRQGQRASGPSPPRPNATVGPNSGLAPAPGSL